MKTGRTVLLLSLLLPFSRALPCRAAERTLEIGRFGTVSLYGVPAPGAAAPHRVALFVSGDGGWNQGVVDMARLLAAHDTLVAGVDIRHYLKRLAAAKEACSYAAADFEALSQSVQKRLALPDYRTPALVGYSSGATLVYALLAEAPPGTFAGAVGLGFCPDLNLAKPLCKGHGLEWDLGKRKVTYLFRPSQLPVPFIALQGEDDKICNPEGTRRFIGEVGNGEVMMLPKVGHGFSVPKNWLPAFERAFARMEPRSSAAAPPAVRDLPLVEVPAKGPARPEMAVVLSGDGGWASLDRELGQALAAAGVPVVGLDSLRYFWTARTPDGAAADLARVLRHYLAAWHRERAALVGYSFGADVLPFLAARLPADLKARTGPIALLGPSREASFEFHVADWLGAGGGGRPVLPELGKLRGQTVLCFYGKEEEDSLCRGLDPALGTVIAEAGGHHFGGDYPALAARILRALPGAASPAAR